MKKLLSLPPQALILLFGALLRIAGVNAAAIRYPEALYIHLAKLPLAEMYRLAPQPAWAQMLSPFAEGKPWVVRLPALLLSLATLWLLYRVMRPLPEWMQIVIAAYAAFFPPFLWMATDAVPAAVWAFLFVAVIAILQHSIPKLQTPAENIPMPRIGWALIALAVFGLLVVGLRYDAAKKGARLDVAAAYIRQNYQPGDVIYYTDLSVALPFDYYLSDLPHITRRNDADFMLAQAFKVPSGDLLRPTPCNGIRRAWVIVPQDSDAELAWLSMGKRVGGLVYPYDPAVEIWLVE
jgi:hypothetical protein